MTSAPRRYASKECLPAPQPTSITLVPAPTPSRSKSTVSIAADPLAGPLVDRDSLRRNGFPAEHVERALSAVRAEALQFQRRVEQFAEHRGQLVDVGGP